MNSRVQIANTDEGKQQTARRMQRRTDLQYGGPRAAETQLGQFGKVGCTIGSKVGLDGREDFDEQTPTQDKRGRRGEEA